MWENCRKKLERLKNLDRRFQVFGAEEHQYILNSRLDEEIIPILEEEFRFKLPLELRRFYMEVGNGIAGPEYGLNSIYQVEGFLPGLPFQSAETLAQKYGGSYGHSALTGLLSIVAEGCGHQVCLVTSGEKSGKVVYVSEGGSISETSKNFVEYYEEWLDTELGRFAAVEKLMRTGAGYVKINNEMLKKFGIYNAGDIISSIADAEKPVELFGTQHHKIYHGEVQIPWYKKILREWQQRNL